MKIAIKHMNEHPNSRKIILSFAFAISSRQCNYSFFSLLFNNETNKKREKKKFENNSSLFFRSHSLSEIIFIKQNGKVLTLPTFYMYKYLKGILRTASGQQHSSFHAMFDQHFLSTSIIY